MTDPTLLDGQAMTTKRLDGHAMTDSTRLDGQATTGTTRPMATSDLLVSMVAR